jgi:hypothetical protein
MAYAIVLFVHSYLRWVLLALALVVLGRAMGGWRSGRAWTRGDDNLGIAFMSLVDVQMLLGLVMYFVLSPVTAAFLAAPRAGMKDHVLRFFGVEHLTGMLFAIVVVHVGRARGKRPPYDTQARARHKLTVQTTLVWLLVTLISIPWPGLVYGRALFRSP